MVGSWSILSFVDLDMVFCWLNFTDYPVMGSKQRRSHVQDRRRDEQLRQSSRVAAGEAEIRRERESRARAERHE